MLSDWTDGSVSSGIAHSQLHIKDLSYVCYAGRLGKKEKSKGGKPSQKEGGAERHGGTLGKGS